jgi:hypothetical protein
LLSFAFSASVVIGILVQAYIGILDGCYAGHGLGLVPEAQLMSSTTPEDEHILWGFVTDQDSEAPLPSVKVKLGTVEEWGGWIRRMVVLSTTTDSEGRYEIRIDPAKTCVSWDPGYKPHLLPFFLEASLHGYLDEFSFQDLERDEPYLPLSTWEEGKARIDIQMTKMPSVPRVLERGRFRAIFWRPEERPAAEIALDKMERFYPIVTSYLGMYSTAPYVEFRFNPSWIQGYADWSGGSKGIATQWKPWYDGLGGVMTDQLQDMWDNAIPHELVHHVMLLNDIRARAWVQEGFAALVGNFLALGTSLEELARDEGIEIIPFQEMRGENIPQYNAAARAIALIAIDHGSEVFIRRVLRTLRYYAVRLSSYKTIDDSTAVAIMSCVAGEDLYDRFAGWGFSIQGIAEEELGLGESPWLTPDANGDGTKNFKNKALFKAPPA